MLVRRAVMIFALLISSVAIAQVPSAPGVASAKSAKAKAAAPGAPSATLSWSASTAGCPCTYNVYKGATSGSEVKIQSGLTTTSFVDTNVVRGSTYYWYVTASNTIGESLPSNEVNATIPNVPIAPSGLTVVVQ